MNYKEMTTESEHQAGQYSREKAPAKLSAWALTYLDRKTKNTRMVSDFDIKFKTKRIIGERDDNE